MTTNSPAAQPQGGELLPCPAGHQAQVCNSDEEMFYVVCLDQNCFWALGEGYDRDAMPDHAFREEEAAVNAWNIRADLPRTTVDTDSAEWIAETTAREFVAKSLLPDDSKLLELSRNDYWQRAKGAELVLERLRAAPRATGETTVEAALAELREMTDHRCEIVFETVGWVKLTVWANSVVSLDLFRTRRSTLAEAMDQVREWSAQVRAATRTEGGGEKS